MADGDVPKHMAYAIATQQGHKVNRSSKKHRTAEGVMNAHQKYTAPASEYQKTAMLAGFFDELDQMEKEGMGWLGRKVIAPLAIAGGLAGGGAKVMSHVGAKVAPTAITQAAEQGAGKAVHMGAGGMMGGRTRAGQEALRLAGM
jgi:hypothetical protein